MYGYIVVIIDLDYDGDMQYVTDVSVSGVQLSHLIEKAMVFEDFNECVYMIRGLNYLALVGNCDSYATWDIVKKEERAHGC